MELPLELRAALEEIARSGELQPSLFPALTPTPNRLAADFDHWWRITREEHRALTKAQARALNQVEEQLAAMSTGVDRRNWTEEAMHASPAWSRLRLLAKSALEELNWVEVEDEVEG